MKKSSIFLWQSELFHSLYAPPRMFRNSKLRKTRAAQSAALHGARKARSGKDRFYKTLFIL
jgi:hypothetical protein